MQEWIVGVIVACAFVAVAKRYLPKALRRAMRTWLAQTAQRIGWDRLAARLTAPELATSCGDGCGACGGCASEQASPVADERFVIKLKTVK